MVYILILHFLFSLPSLLQFSMNILFIHLTICFVLQLKNFFKLFLICCKETVTITNLIFHASYATLYQNLKNPVCANYIFITVQFQLGSKKYEINYCSCCDSTHEYDHRSNISANKSTILQFGLPGNFKDTY